jgi:hypothetical protein
LAGAPISAADLSRGAEKDAKPSVSALLSSPPRCSPDGFRREAEPAGAHGEAAASEGAESGAL